MAALLFIAFIVLLILGVPVAFSLFYFCGGFDGKGKGFQGPG